jgi:type VI secretion system protein VasG
VLRREEAAGADHAERLARIAVDRAATEARLAELKARWERELALVRAIRDAREALEAARHPAPGNPAPGNPAPVDASPNGEPADPAALRAELARLTAELEAAQGETPLVRVCVDASLVGEVISGWTGIPVGKMLRDEMGMVLEMERHLGGRVVGQAHALEVISRRIRTSRAGIEDPRKPKGVFLLVGPSGVGKTETALALADLLFGGERNLITINMSEFQEAHTVSTLKGSPPGYVGYGEGGVLTEAVRRRPYSVVLLDEVEKAHPDVLELFFQVFDKGSLEDGEGRQIDFRNTVIILTTNAGTDSIMRLTADPETAPSADALARALKPELDKVFKPAFLGRLVIVPFYPVRDEVLRRIVRMKVDRVRQRLLEAHRVALVHDDALIDLIAARCTEVESGARNVDNILTNTVLPEISRLLLARMAESSEGRLGAIRLTTDARGELAYEALPVAGGPPAGEGPGSMAARDAQPTSAEPSVVGPAAA